MLLGRIDIIVDTLQFKLKVVESIQFYIYKLGYRPRGFKLPNRPMILTLDILYEVNKYIE